MEKPSELLERVEWLQKLYFKYNTDSEESVLIGCCMRGAVAYSLKQLDGNGLGVVLGSEKDKLSNKFDRLIKDIGPIEKWNDTPGRTKEEVIAKLKEYGL